MTESTPTAHAFDVPKTPVPPTYTSAQILDFKTKISTLLKEQNAVLVAHYYTDSLVQETAEETGGFIGDSLEMARFGAQTEASTVIVAGVRWEHYAFLHRNKRHSMQVAYRCRCRCRCRNRFRYRENKDDRLSTP